MTSKLEHLEHHLNLHSRALRELYKSTGPHETVEPVFMDLHLKCMALCMAHLKEEETIAFSFRSLHSNI